MQNKISELKAILRRSALYYPLQSAIDVNFARTYLQEAIEILKSMKDISLISEITELEKIHTEFNNYYKLKITKTNYAVEFEQKKSKAVRIIKAILTNHEKVG